MAATPGRRALLGLLITAVVLGLGFLGTRFAQGAFADDYRVSVTLGETGQGVISGSDVVARGVIVGEVGEIGLDDQLNAVVELVLEPRYTIPSDARFAVTGKTLLGEKQVEILFDGEFDAADAIADGGAVTDPDQVVELQDVLQELDGLFGAIDPTDLAIVIDDGLGAFDGQGPAIARAVDQGARASSTFARSLDDQVPAIRDLSLVAEALGPRGDDLDRLARSVDGGALDTLVVNQDRLRVLLDTLDAFAEQLDVVLELTRGDLDRLMIQGDNVTRLLFTYRPEVADVLVGISDYSQTLGEGGLKDPGFTGNGAGFQILLEEDPQAFCAEAPPQIAGLIPACAGGAPAAAAAPAPPVPLASLPAPAATPELPARAGLDAVIDRLLAGAAVDLGAAATQGGAR